MGKNIGVIIPAAGAGKRLGGISKPLIEVDGNPVIHRILALFSELENVTGICLAVPGNSLAEYRSIVKLANYRSPIEIVEGGSERSLSVQNAFVTIQQGLSDDDVVCIHDAARPLLSKEDLERVIDAAWTHDAAFLASRVKDTLKHVDERGFSISTIDRAMVFAAQTPQVIKAGLLKDAYRKVKDLSGKTDEIMLLEEMSIKAFVVESRHPNFKITTYEDLALLKKMVS